MIEPTLIWSPAPADGQVGQPVVFGFAAAGADGHAQPAPRASSSRRRRFGQRADLVDLQQQSVAGSLGDRRGGCERDWCTGSRRRARARGRRWLASRPGQFPVVLGQTVFDADDRVSIRPTAGSASIIPATRPGIPPAKRYPPATVEVGRRDVDARATTSARPRTRRRRIASKASSSIASVSGNGGARPPSSARSRRMPYFAVEDQLRGRLVDGVGNAPGLRRSSWPPPARPGRPGSAPARPACLPPLNRLIVRRGNAPGAPQSVREMAVQRHAAPATRKRGRRRSKPRGSRWHLAAICSRVPSNATRASSRSACRRKLLSAHRSGDRAVQVRYGPAATRARHSGAGRRREVPALPPGPSMRPKERMPMRRYRHPKSMSASTVGRPRLSRISLPDNCSTSGIEFLRECIDQARNVERRSRHPLQRNPQLRLPFRGREIFERRTSGDARQ